MPKRNPPTAIAASLPRPDSNPDSNFCLPRSLFLRPPVPRCGGFLAIVPSAHTGLPSVQGLCLVVKSNGVPSGHVGVELSSHAVKSSDGSDGPDGPDGPL